MNRLARLTVRARLTLLCTGLFALCGAIVVAVSYILVAQIGTTGQVQQPSSDSLRGSIVAQCQSEQSSDNPDKPLIARCISALEQQGARHQRDLTLSHLLEYSLITLVVVMALAAILGWIFSGRALRPVHRITAAARTASEHNLSARVALGGPHDELRELAETFDEMLARLEAAFEGQRRFIANASHELRTPLAVMRTTVDVVAGNPDSTPSELRDMAIDIRVAVDHAEQLIGALFILARSERGLTVCEEIDLATVAEDVLDAAALDGLRLHATLEPAVIAGDPMLVERLIGNVIDNAVRYNTAAGDIWISTRTADDSSQLIVANTGAVISATDIDRIFQPFQRLNSRTTHDGFGLGLAIVTSIATIHGGTAAATPRADGGLTLTVTIPSGNAPGAGVRTQTTGRHDAPSPN
jgi:signal transduction histidine kinase